MLLIDAMAASGSEMAVSVLLEKIKSKEISNGRAISILMTLPNNIIYSGGVREMIVSRTCF